MNKVIGFFAGLLVVASAFAMPAVGDLASYNLAVTTTSGALISGTMDTKIVSVDQTKTNYTIQTNVVFGGQANNKQEVKAAKDMVTDQAVAYAMANCPAQGGHLETITVVAGTFNTCVLPVQGDSVGTMWIVAGVPFAAVKMDVTQKSGQRIQLEVRSFQNGH